MTVLAIETATAVCAASVVRDGAVLAESRVESRHVHSEKLLPMMDEAFRSAGVAPAQIDGIAVSIGPGSFTGLRIGLSVAKGLAYAWEKPLIPVQTLEALAMHAVEQSLAVAGGFVLPMIDARRAEVYAALYRRVGGNLEEIIPPRAAQLRDLEGILPGESPVVVMGDGAVKFLEYLELGKSPARSRFVFPPMEARQCSASAVGLLGERALAAGRTGVVADLEPFYVKDFQSLVGAGQHGVVS
ncbi:MAG TPA: tRNA (adenosine(37)-N6)-threonylcarbamoyltransferase complex dimerization subunit type 1 TsaB [Bacteroidota bacterium]|jgi:tRNA threonylcarbamoyladenosine biosynthesis protein TsaB